MLETVSGCCGGWHWWPIFSCSQREGANEVWLYFMSFSGWFFSRTVYSRLPPLNVSLAFSPSPANSSPSPPARSCDWNMTCVSLSASRCHRARSLVAPRRTLESQWLPSCEYRLIALLQVIATTEAVQLRNANCHTSCEISFTCDFPRRSQRLEGEWAFRWVAGRSLWRDCHQMFHLVAD